MRGLAPLLLLGAPAGAAPAPPAPRPVIAVFTQDTRTLPGAPADPAELLAASYVKWVEQEGARVVPAVMGTFVPASARHAWRLALAANAAGVPLPVWGTCLGFEWIVQLAAADDGVIGTGLDAENISLPLALRPAADTSRLLGGAANARLRAALGARPLTMNNHERGITPEAFDAHPALGRALRVLSTSTDRRGTAFVSTLEGVGLPVFATQWHPEKAQFEWGWRDGAPYEAIDHSAEAVGVSQHFARVFMAHARAAADAARAAGRAEPPDDWASELVWNFPLSLRAGPAFVQVYCVHALADGAEDAAGSLVAHAAAGARANATSAPGALASRACSAAQLRQLATRRRPEPRAAAAA
ncbi:hypothetical protein KFE25_005654 [Diacronema lutheri]|uniref:folate gamma-glutamyl hydrolase n=1 Tax=Diacronema lutheri TaxID=2081491 RepID=A0A8J5XT52_DIALT|nr:hypothetical protein KFE25_005654 [Diacronema lutheri]